MRERGEAEIPGVIAFRVLTYAPLDGGPDLAIPIRMFAPEEYKPGAFRCRFEIDWPEDPLKCYGAGMDEFQALDLTMKMIGLSIYNSPYHESSRLWLSQPGRGYAFPVLSSERELLIGDDIDVYG